MEFQEIKMKGKFWVEKVSTLPTWTNGDGGRLIYVENDNKCYVGRSSDFKELSFGSGFLQGDGVDDRVIRHSILYIIDDSDEVDEIICTFLSQWNGDSIAQVDKIGKGETQGDFTLSISGEALTINNSGLSGNVITVLGSILADNETGTALICDVRENATDIRVAFKNSADGSDLDITQLVDNGELTVRITYITDE